MASSCGVTKTCVKKLHLYSQTLLYKHLFSGQKRWAGCERRWNIATKRIGQQRAPLEAQAAIELILCDMIPRDLEGAVVGSLRFASHPCKRWRRGEKRRGAPGWFRCLPVNEAAGFEVWAASCSELHPDSSHGDCNSFEEVTKAQDRLQSSALERPPHCSTLASTEGPHLEQFKS